MLRGSTTFTMFRELHEREDELMRVVPADGAESRDALNDGDRPTAVRYLRTHGRHNVPARLTSFVGREAEKSELARLLASSRVVTLTGSGGSGKTRLAVEVARDLVDRWDDGVWWVDLGGLAEPDLVPVEVAGALGLTPTADEPPVQSILRHLGSRRVLLVLDNCEHLIAASAEVVSAVTRDCTGVTVMLTSREGLHVEGEAIFAVPPLSLPASDGTDPQTSEAVRLFFDRARLVRPNFRLDAETTPSVIEICRRLDGIPLAIELAAARVRILTPAQIAEGLSDRFRLLTGGPRTALPRQRTLDASVEWSYRLLSPEQQLVFARLSVFAGTFGLDAAEHVCSGDDLPPVEVLDLLAGLVDRSLVQVEEGRGEARYRLLESIRVYARDRLADLGDPAEVRTRHLEYFIGVANDASVGLAADFHATFAGLKMDVDNLRAAMDWAMTSGRSSAVIDIAEPISPFWTVRALYAEVLARLRSAVTADGVGPSDRARGLVTASIIAYMGGDFPAGYDFADEALSLEDDLDPRLVPLALSYRAWAGFHSRKASDAQIWDDVGRALDLSEADDNPARRGRVVFFAGTLEMFGRSVEAGKGTLREILEVLSETFPHPITITPIRLFLANAWHWDGLTADAKAHYEEVLRVGGPIGYHYFVSLALVHLSFIDLVEGDPQSARRRVTQARQVAPRAAMGHVLFAEGVIAYEDGHLQTALQTIKRAIELESGSLEMFVAWAEVAAGQCALMLGDTASARQFFESARTRSLDPRYPSGVGRSLVFLALLSLDEDDIEQAAALAYDGLDVMAGYGDRVALPAALILTAALSAEIGASDRAARLLGSAERLSSETANIRSFIFASIDDLRENTKVAVRGQLGEDEFDRCFAEGAALTLEEAVAYAQRGRGQRGRPSSGWQSLTPTEVEVVRHVADGCSNAEIAERLFVSPNTVKTHLAHVYTKLGLSSRSELAGAAARRDL